MLLQLGAAARGIVRYERTLADGELVLFRCVPLTLPNPFRGRYVHLSYGLEPSPAKVLGEPVTGYNEPGYALLHTDANGFAVIDYATKTRPGEGLFIKVTLSTYGGDTALVTPVFNRYYMAEESRPPRNRLTARPQCGSATPPTPIVRTRWCASSTASRCWKG